MGLRLNWQIDGRRRDHYLSLSDSFLGVIAIKVTLLGSLVAEDPVSWVDFSGSEAPLFISSVSFSGKRFTESTVSTKEAVMIHKPVSGIKKPSPHSLVLSLTNNRVWTPGCPL